MTSAHPRNSALALALEAFAGYYRALWRLGAGMKQGRSIGLISRAAAPEPHAVAAATAPLQKEEHEFPLIIANLPATREHVAIAAGVAILLVVAVVITAPFAHIQLARVDAFIPVLQTSLTIVDFITATFLFAQYSIQPQRALLALASGYMFSGSFAFLQTLAFPGGYAPAGLIGDGPNSPAWIYVLWHTTFSWAILVYAFTKDTPEAPRRGKPAITRIAVTVASVFAVVAGLTWGVTTKADYLPRFYIADVGFQTPLGNQANGALLLWASIALVALLFRRRTILDLWLMLTLLAYLPNFLVAMIGSSVRFSVGWYAARCFVLIGSCMLLGVLIIETIFLYSRLASAMTLQRRERFNRFLSVEAVTGAVAHELRTPLAAMALNVDTALGQLKSNPREAKDVEDILGDIKVDINRAAAIITSVREMTTKSVNRTGLTNAEDVGQLALRLLKHDLQANEISVTTEFQGDLPDVQIDGMELQQVLLNLFKNAIDAMKVTRPEARRLRLKTTFDGHASVLVWVEDSGHGVPAENRERIFEPFFTTQPDGMGLGLAISSTLVARYGGKLNLLKSDSDGSIFELALPISGQASTA